MSLRLSRLTRPLILYAFAIGGLLSCSAMVPVHIGGTGDRPVATFGVRADRPERACVEAFTVTREAGETSETLWSVEARRGGCRNVSQIAYAEVPSGFVAQGAAVPLRAGEVYTVRAFGRSRSALSAAPWRWAGEYIFENGQWRGVTPQERARLAH